MGVLSIALALAAAACLLLAPPMSGSASANACTKYGHKLPSRLHVPQARRAVVCLVNRKRRDHHMGRLHMDRRLRHAAQKHSDYMLNHHCYDHQCSGERSTLGRLQLTGYITGGLTRWAYGENIAWGPKSYGTPANIVSAWMHSAEHRANILSGTFRDVGAGFAKGSPTKKGANAGMYTLDFGLRQG